jgi:mannitol-1-phosphate 5-dehydrogenase
MPSVRQHEPLAIHFGAGNIGRGFIGPLLVDAGYTVIFADIDKDVISAIHDLGYYDVHILDNKELGKPVEDISVAHIDGILSTAPELIDKIAEEADIITTAVGPSVLAKIAGTVAQGLQRRAENDVEKTLNIIACENMVGATDQFKQHILEHLPSDSSSKVHKYLADHVGFANCSVDRIVPPQNGSGEDSDTVDLDVSVEPFYEWVIEEPALKKPLPLSISDAKYTSNLSAYIERKLFTLNTGHALTAYLGFLQDKNSTIDAAISNPEILKVVKGGMAESGEALKKKHKFSSKDHERYIESILTRFRNPNMKDEVMRVGRSPLRKLGEGDRLLGPIKMCREYGLKRDNLLIGVAAALRYDNPDDEESAELQRKIKDKGIEAFVKELVGEDHEAVLEAYRK